MSERTSSPSMDHTTHLPDRTSLPDEFASPFTGRVGPIKRKWSLDHSDLGNLSLISHDEPSRANGIVSPEGVDSHQALKRAKVKANEHAGSPAPSTDRKIPHDRSCLPGEMWQYIFTCLPPKSLGRLLSVNRAFCALLTPGGKTPTQQLPSQGCLILMEQERIWSLSRRAFFPGMPRSLFPGSELRTWRLLRSNRCEFCGKTNRTAGPPVATSPWAAGPGNEYVRVVWPFAVRSCGGCLRARLRKEADLLFSTSSVLSSALPFAFLTPSLNYVASITLRSEPPPTGLQLIKWYFGPQVDQMKAKLDEVRELGIAAAEEWFKGLESEGKDNAAHTARWEHWELAGGFQAVSRDITESQCLGRSDHGHSAIFENETRSGSETVKNDGFSSSTATISALSCLRTNHAPPASLPPKPATPVSTYGLPLAGTPTFPPAPKLVARVERSLHNVNEMKNARRAEIERRCAELVPPIKPSILPLMESFAAAIQIAMPLTDQAWELLKPRLLAQREAAEQMEREQLAQNEIVLQQTEERRQQEAQLKAAKEHLDMEWEESQKSVRERLETYADNFIQEQWQNGDAINQSSCAQFAADMLLHVRHRFYTALTQEDGRMRALGIPVPTDSPHTVSSRKLTLENMRWVYENKIKPLTDHLQKELFLCNVCDNHGRYYSLDSVVQHFAAKHTDSLSMGTAVVYWKADWPELPPFDPNPTAARASMYASAMNSPSLPSAQSMYTAPPPYQGQFANTAIHADSALYPAPFNAQYTYGRPSQGYKGHTPALQDPLSPQNAFYKMDQTSSRIYNQVPTSANPTGAGYLLQPQSVFHDWQPQHVPGNAVSLYQPFSASQPGPAPEFGPRPASAVSHVSQHAPYLGNLRSSSQVFKAPVLLGGRPKFNPIQPGQPMGIYQVQIQELANNAREVWNGTSGILNMPDNVRIQVIIRHVVLRFKDKYTNEPNLALFTDGLNNSSQMTPLRDLCGLVCKACTIASKLGARYHHDPQLERRLHTLPALLAHFQSAHVEHVPRVAILPTGVEMPRQDWKFDMIEMPDPAAIRSLMYSPGINQTKLNLIATVLPSYFPTPLPQVDPIPYQAGSDRIAAGTEFKEAPHYRGRERGADGPRPTLHASDSALVSHSPRIALERDDVTFQRLPYGPGRDQSTSKATEMVGDDEYDPHRPAYIKAAQAERRLVERSPSQAQGLFYKDFPVQGGRGIAVARENYEIVARNRGATPASEYLIPESSRPSSGRFTGSDDRDVHVRKASFHELRDHWPVPESRSVQVERRDSPGHEPLNAAEEFLRSFDATSDAMQGPSREPAAPALRKKDEYGFRDGVDSSFRAGPEGPSWQSDRVKVRPVEYSGNSSPSNPPPTLERFPDEEDAALYPRQTRGHDAFYGGTADPRIRSPASSLASLDNQAPTRARPGHLLHRLRSVRNSPLRRPNSRFERYEAQRQGSQRPQTRSPVSATDILPVNDAAYDDLHAPKHGTARPAFVAEPTEQQDDYLFRDETMYRRTAQPSTQIRYLERPAHFEAGYERPIEYVRVAPRDLQTPGEYYIQRPLARDGEYVGYEPSCPQEQVFERNGRLYTRAPPSPEDNRNAYSRQLPYQ